VASYRLGDQVELHQLRYVLAVTECGSFSRAAEKLFVVQSNVSAQVRKLERELGVELFDRRPHEVVPTAFGRAFLPRVRECLAALEDARTSLDALRGLTSGSASLGVLGTVVSWLMPTVTRRFLQSYPGIDLWLTEEPSSILSGMIASRDIPQALVILPTRRHDLLEYEPLFHEELVALVPDDHPLQGAGSVPLNALGDEDVLLPESGNQLRDAIQDACTLAGFEPRIRIEVGKKQLARELAVAGVAIALMPAVTALHDVAGATDRVVRIAEPRITRSVGLVRHLRSTLSPADAALSDIIREVVRERLESQLTVVGGAATTDRPLVELAAAPAYERSDAITMT
jgi:LysR family transcriptional regulator, transcription activator of glutamate synthase operon